MLVGYARVSTRDQTHALQLDALRKAECERIFEETASGAQRARPQLAAALDYVRKGDTIVVWKLDRLARRSKRRRNGRNPALISRALATALA